ncbi:hypothetical protein [Saccharothrix sp. HUAS TT1]|uniref:hypothetical protein n=1 Tax=unclassified Saccharothrix TaxID=2593673 RepID=UPI00345C4A82
MTAGDRPDPPARDLPDIAAAVARLADQRYRRTVGIQPAAVERARQAAANMALATAIGRVAGALGPDYGPLRILAEHLRVGRLTGVDVGDRHRQVFPEPRARLVADTVRDIARVLAASGVDLLDDGRTVAGLFAYGDALSPREHVTGIALTTGALLMATAGCSNCGWGEVFPYARPGESDQALRAADEAARAHEADPGRTLPDDTGDDAGKDMIP